MNTFTWTDDMVKETCRKAVTLLSYDHTANNFEYRLNELISIQKTNGAKGMEGTFENKVYWRVNLDNLCISPVSEIPPIEDGDLYFTTYPEAGNYVTKILTKNLFNNAQK